MADDAQFPQSTRNAHLAGSFMRDYHFRTRRKAARRKFADGVPTKFKFRLRVEWKDLHGPTPNAAWKPMVIQTRLSRTTNHPIPTRKTNHLPRQSQRCRIRSVECRFAGTGLLNLVSVPICHRRTRYHLPCHNGEKSLRLKTQISDRASGEISRQKRRYGCFYCVLSLSSTKIASRSVYGKPSGIVRKPPSYFTSTIDESRPSDP